MVIASTASPYKFANNVYKAVSGNDPSSDLGALDELSSYTSTEIPYPLAGLESRAVRFTEVIDRDEMKNSILHFID